MCEGIVRSTKLCPTTLPLLLYTVGCAINLLANSPYGPGSLPTLARQVQKLLALGRQVSVSLHPCISQVDVTLQKMLCVQIPVDLAIMIMIVKFEVVYYMLWNHHIEIEKKKQP